MKYLYTLIIILSFSTQAIAQIALKNADKLFKAQSYVKASEAYEDYLTDAKNEISTQTLLNAADANYYNYNTQKAKQYYQRAFDKDGNLTGPYLLRYIRTLRSEGDYDSAHQLYTNYLLKNKDAESVAMNNQRYQEFLELLNSKEEPVFRLTNLTSNSIYSDFAPVIYGDSLIFSSSRSGNAKGLYSWNEQPYLSLFMVPIINDSIMGTTQIFSKSTQTNYHDATIAFMSDTTSVFFTTSNLNDKNKLVLAKKAKNHFQLYKGTLVKGIIENKEKVAFNSDFYSVSHPFVSKDNKYLFFASDMPNGYGGSDIYYSTFLSDGSLSEPINAGATINTSGNEFFPFLFEDTLYYSSNGIIGFGGQDIFSSEFDRSNASFSSPINLGQPINSRYDDFSIVFKDDGRTGYLASNRPGGVGDDDIYFFTKEPLSCFQLITGNIIDKRSKETLENATITVQDSQKTVLTIVKTNSDGNYEAKLPCNMEVTLIAEKEEYLEDVKVGKTGAIHAEVNDPINFELEKAKNLIIVDELTKEEKIDIGPIYFDFDKADITLQATVVLSNAVKLMKFFPEMVIKIESHTDSRGSDNYNLQLSDRRAKATQKYLYSQGIDKERIVSAIGYGERRLLNNCKDGVKCSDQEHDVNRRSDFIILKR